ncbi:hypothetical protein BDW02DRAFT_96481 [Decorospora gaudefroyi]|uniref:EthD domain-containing protein n=1 Tax=Decorospora gaudefroyi TaxID=184978 RepID=A0A6A5KHJ2_9PLEO|nr:hypothetical protein BDW02DRAFT_96481 [Decorospora gaudefroyi]
MSAPPPNQEAVKGPGILFVRSRIAPANKDILSPSTLLHWYDKIHIPDVVSTSGIKSAFRFIDTAIDGADAEKVAPKTNTKPYLAMYPMQDLAFTNGDEFRGISVKSDVFPGGGAVYDFVELEVWKGGIVGKTEKKHGAAKPKFILSVGIRPGTDVTEEKIEDFFDKQITALATNQDYIRSLRFKLLFARTNAQSRAFKGLPPATNAVEEDATKEPSTWLAVHEFAEMPAKDVVDGGCEWEKEVLVWRLDAVHGEGKFFDE